jgi:hypothetical protein
MDSVTITFTGHNAEEVAQRFNNLLVDGGLEDTLIDLLSDEDVRVEGIGEGDDEGLDVTMVCVEGTIALVPSPSFTNAPWETGRVF